MTDPKVIAAMLRCYADLCRNSGARVSDVEAIEAQAAAIEQAAAVELLPKAAPLPTHADLWGAALRNCDCMWSRFPCWLIDHAEGATLTEEMLQHELAAMLAASPAQGDGK